MRSSWANSSLSSTRRSPFHLFFVPLLFDRPKIPIIPNDVWTCNLLLCASSYSDFLTQSQLASSWRSVKFSPSKFYSFINPNVWPRYVPGQYNDNKKCNPSPLIAFTSCVFWFVLSGDFFYTAIRFGLSMHPHQRKSSFAVLNGHHLQQWNMFSVLSLAIFVIGVEQVFIGRRTNVAACNMRVVSPEDECVESSNRFWRGSAHA